MHETTIILVRHPETVANTEGTFVGRGDSPYSAEGRLQLRRAARRVREYAPDHIWSSPLERALELAARAAHDCEVGLTVEDDLQELDFGAVEGMTYTQIAAAGLTLDYASWDSPVAPGGESRQDLANRSQRVVDRIIAEGGTSIVVTHGGVFRASLTHLLGLSHEAIWAFHIHNAQFAVVRVIDGRGMLEEFVQA